MASHHVFRCRQYGFSYVEVLTAAVIMAVCLAPALDALRDGISVAEMQRAHAVSQQRLKTRMEEVLANRFSTLEAAAMAAGNSPAAIVAAYSDASGTADRLRVTIYRYDGSAATGSDSGLLWVRAGIEGATLELNALKSR